MKFLVVLLLLMGLPAEAYQLGRVSSDNAVLKLSPKDDADPVGTLSIGTRINAIDHAVNGYYLVSSATQSGWLAADSIDFKPSARLTASQPTPSPAPSPSPGLETSSSPAPIPAAASSPSPSSPLSAVAASTPAPSASPAPSQQISVSQRLGPEVPKVPVWKLKAFIGTNTFSMTDVSSMIGSSVLNSATGYVLELGRRLSENLTLALRLEYLTKSTTGQAAGGAGDQIDFALSSIPVMVGVTLPTYHEEGFSLDVGAFAGLGLSTRLSVTDQSAAAPNVTTISATAPSLLTDADFTWTINPTFFIIAEVGYRYLQSAPTSPSQIGTGGGILSPTSDPSNIPPLEINMSGFTFNAGIRVDL